MLKELKGGTSSIRGRRRTHRRKTALIVTVVALSFMVLLVVAGLIYLWWMGNHTTITPTTLPNTNSVVATPRKVADNIPVGVALSSFNSPASVGSDTSISIRTLPGAACSISVTYSDTEKVNDIALVPKIADDYGSVNWNWKVPTGQKPGKWPVEVTCARNDKSGYYKDYLVVTP